MRKYAAWRSLGLPSHPDEGAYTHFGPDMGMGLGIQGLQLPELVTTTNVVQMRDDLSIIPHYGQAAMMDVYPTERGICTSYEAEAFAQPIRLAAGILGGPGVIYIASQLPEERQGLRWVGYGLGAACIAWNLMIWNKVRQAQRG